MRLRHPIVSECTVKPDKRPQMLDSYLQHATFTLTTVQDNKRTAIMWRELIDSASANSISVQEN